MPRVQRPRRPLDRRRRQGDSRRDQVRPRRRHPSVAASRRPSRPRGAGGGGLAPRVLPRTSRSRTFPGRPGGSCSRETATGFREPFPTSGGGSTPSFPGSAGTRGRRRKAPGRSRSCAPYLSEERCRECDGERLRRESRAVRRRATTIGDLVRLPVSDVLPALVALPFGERERPVASRLLHEITARLQFLDAVGVGYLSLDRPTTTLSGGEAHRVRLATQIGARLQGILYVLDEPSVGLHQRDNARLLATLKSIRDLGQHRGGGGARRGDDPRRRLRRGPRGGRRPLRRTAHVPGPAGVDQREPDRALPASGD